MKDRASERLTTADYAARAEEARRNQEEDARDLMRQDDDFASREAHDNGDGRAPLFRDQDLDELRSRWSTIQTGFVDEPRRAVEEADGLVASTIGRLAESFADERSHLEGQWSRGSDVSTEDLRLALRRYRSFFDRLLSV
jgi:hypothetical protein